jgi:hypothetical protein
MDSSGSGPFDYGLAWIAPRKCGTFDVTENELASPRDEKAPLSAASMVQPLATLEESKLHEAIGELI